MIAKVITGGQTGADQAGWRSARAAGFATGGLMPRGFLTEDGPRPDFAPAFGAEEHHAADPDGRTVANVLAADATLVFATEPCGPGTRLTIATCHAAGRPCQVVRLGAAGLDATPGDVAAWIVGHPVRILNVAGERESTAPGLGAWVEEFLGEVFRGLLAGTS
jgi:hypothetical protein